MTLCFAALWIAASAKEPLATYELTGPYETITAYCARQEKIGETHAHCVDRPETISAKVVTGDAQLVFVHSQSSITSDCAHLAVHNRQGWFVSSELECVRPLATAMAIDKLEFDAIQVSPAPFLVSWTETRHWTDVASCKANHAHCRPEVTTLLFASVCVTGKTTRCTGMIPAGFLGDDGQPRRLSLALAQDAVTVSGDRADRDRYQLVFGDSGSGPAWEDYIGEHPLR